MKANNKEKSMDDVKQDINAEEQKPVEQGEPLIGMEVLKPKFSHLTAQILQFTKYAEEINVDTGTSLTVAKNNTGLINETLKNIDKVRKVLKDPYRQTADLIDTYARTLTKPLEEAKSTINGAITNYKNIQTAAATLEAEKIRLAAGILADEKSEEADKINRVESQLVARIYGGSWFNKENQRKTSSGCVTPFEGDALKKIIKDKLPSPDEFKHLQKEYKDMLKDVKKKLSSHISNLIESGSESKTIKDHAEKEIQKARDIASGEVNQKKDDMAQEIIKEARTEIKTATADIKEAGKGIRRTLKFEVIDIKKVPEEWLLINEKAVREWANSNKKLVIELVEVGDGTHKGMKFTFEKLYVSR